MVIRSAISLGMVRECLDGYGMGSEPLPVRRRRSYNLGGVDVRRRLIEKDRGAERAPPALLDAHGDEFLRTLFRAHFERRDRDGTRGRSEHHVDACMWGSDSPCQKLMHPISPRLFLQAADAAHPPPASTRRMSSRYSYLSSRAESSLKLAAVYVLPVAQHRFTTINTGATAATNQASHRLWFLSCSRSHWLLRFCSGDRWCRADHDISVALGSELFPTDV